MTAVPVRRGGPDDLAAIIRVHMASWRHTYKDLLPQDMIDGLTEPELMDTWSARLDTASEQAVFVADNAEVGVIGFSSAAPSSEPDFPNHGMLDTLYLLPDAQGRGTGRALLQAVAAELSAQGASHMLVVVLETNPAAQFYGNMGGKVVQTRTRLHRGHMCPELVFEWRLPLGGRTS